jgi:aspartyl-tRNA synthetase
MLRTHTCNELSAQDINKIVTLTGWVRTRRDHGGIIFIDLRDAYGLTQIVFDPEVSATAHEAAEHIRSEWVLQITGTVKARTEGMANAKLETGEIEVFVEKLEILNQAKTPPFELDREDLEVREDLRLQYRYLDLRREKMQKNIRLRHNMVKVIRDYFDENGFIDIETPIMVKGTPEGSREYLVPSRIHPGEFYVLPQSPQQLKQLLMVGGMDKYFQIARCFRDEDLRGDRQPEFTQFEIEMSFVEQEDVLQSVEGVFHKLAEQFATDKDWKSYLENGQFKRLTWQEAMTKYGSDKPDLRFGLEFVDATDLAKDSGFGIFAGSKHLFALGVPKADAKFSRKDIDILTDLARSHGAGGLAWLRVGEDAGPVAKNAKPEFIAELLKRTGTKNGDIIFFGAGDFIKATEPLGAVRKSIGDKYEIANPNHFAFCWVTDFPLFGMNDEGKMGAAHHPFTQPHPEDIDKLKTDPMSVRSVAYDIVLNGVELGGGSMRIHNHDLQHQLFETLGMDEEEIQMKFGHILKAFEYGCPPHGGCAMGLDRVVMLFAGEPNIREVMAFPKNQSAQDLMLGAPSRMPDKEVHEQNIQVLEED